MPKATAICYLSSLLFYGMGFSKITVLKNAVTEYVNTYDYTTNVFLATGVFCFGNLLCCNRFFFSFTITFTFRIIENKKLLK